MLAKATKDARARAIASEAGAGIGAITNTDSGSYDTRTIEKDITAVMAVTFRVE